MYAMLPAEFPNDRALESGLSSNPRESDDDQSDHVIMIEPRPLPQLQDDPDWMMQDKRAALMEELSTAIMTPFRRDSIRPFRQFTPLRVSRLEQRLFGHAIKRPAPIGPVPRMLDQLKRRCTRLLLKPADSAVTHPIRVPVQVWLNANIVQHLLAYWNGCSAFATPSFDSTGERETDRLKSQENTKLSLLVWRAPVLAPASSVRVLEAYHVIPVTLLEAARFHHIPVEMREGTIHADLRAHINSKLAALIETTLSD
jgi:hypothetical protein